MSHPTLTALIHTRNEAASIKACIASCQKIADEVIIVDMESTDKTVSIAQKVGAKIVSVKNSGYVESARQKGIDSAKGDWVLLLDADETIPTSLRKKIPALIRQNQYDIYRLPRKNFFLGQWMKHGLQWPDYQVRLFRRNSVEWPDVIHTQPILNGVVHNLPIDPLYAITHTYRTSISQAVQKIMHQSSHEQYYSVGKPPTTNAVMKRILNDFSWRYFDNNGYKDGVRGFILAKFWEYYRFLEFAFYCEKYSFPEIIHNPSEVKLKKLQTQVNELKAELAQIKDSKFFIFFTFYQKVKNLVLPSK